MASVGRGTRSAATRRGGRRGGAIPRALLAVVAAALTGSSAQAEDHVPPWTPPGFPGWARSALILKGDQPIRAEPRGDAPRRGSALRQARLPLFAGVVGPGCSAHWLQVGPHAWLCEDDVSLSGSAPLPLVAPRAWGVRPGADGLPFRYYFVGPDGSLAYERIDDVDVGEPVMTLEPGFAVAIVEQRSLARSLYGRTNRGLWVPMRDLGAARPLGFRGSDIEGPVADTIRFAWVHVDRARLWSRHGTGFVANGRSRRRFDRVGYLETATSFQGTYARIDEHDWIAARNIRHPTVAPPPPEVHVAAAERWLDIELESQTLVAYEGDRPVFATLVSTGRGRGPTHPSATPVGVHRIWVKLLTSVMDNLENDEASRYYRIEDVPYVQYFAKAVGLHAAFWHRSFGRVRSHGCVNLTPLDAARLFRWTGPRLPNGWTAALPTEFDPGTIVRVRREST